MHGLRGLRLAVYDELLERGLLDAAAIGEHLRPDQRADVQLEDAIGWLVRHRFVVAGSGQRWEAREAEAAREVWERLGVCKENFAAAGSLASVKERGDGRNQEALGSAHLHAEAGGGVGAGAGIAGETPAPRVAVQPHQVEFFALEGYKL